MNGPSLPALLQRFFTERLVTQQGASPHTVAGYRDTFRLLFRFTSERLGRAPSALRLDELDVTLLETFLDHLERVRGNGPCTRATTACRRSMRSSGTWPWPSRR